MAFSITQDLFLSLIGVSKISSDFIGIYSISQKNWDKKSKKLRQKIKKIETKNKKNWDKKSKKLRQKIKKIETKSKKNWD